MVYYLAYYFLVNTESNILLKVIIHRSTKFN